MLGMISPSKQLLSFATISQRAKDLCAQPRESDYSYESLEVIISDILTVGNNLCKLSAEESRGVRSLADFPLT